MCAVKSNYTIAICDILGFTKLVEDNTLDTVVESHLAWLRKALRHSIHKGDFPEEVPTLEDLQSNASLGLAWFSDTILIYTIEDTDDALRELLTCLGWLVFETIIGGNTRLRCGVSYGEVFIDRENSLYVGEPLIEAHRLEQAQTWSGGALTPKAAQRVPEVARSGHFVDWFVVPYEVPLKHGSIKTLAIDWTIGIHKPDLDLRWSSRHPEPSADDWRVRPDICENWRNTKTFHDDMCHWCNRNKTR